MIVALNIRKFSAYAIAAAVINAVIFLLAKSVDATMVVKAGSPLEINLPMVIGETLVPLLIAAFVTSLIGKKSQSFLSKSAWIGGLFGILSSIAPLTATDDSKTAIALASCHIVASVLWYIGIKRSTK